MKPKIIFYATTALIFAFLLSCEDDTPAPGQNNICLASRIDLLNEQVCNGDTIQENDFMDFSYDSDNRLVSYFYEEEGAHYEFFYDSSGKLDSINVIDSGYYLFTWNGSIVLREYFNNNELDSYAEIEFNSNDEIIRIDYYDSESAKTFYELFTWSNNNIIKLEWYYPQSQIKHNNFSDSSTISFKNILFNKADLVSKCQNKSVLTNHDDEFYLWLILEYSYDNKINPFSYHSALSMISQGPLFFSKNNTTTATSSFPDNPEWGMTLEYTLEYNSYNYPKSIYATEEVDNDCYHFFMLEYNYQNCE